MPLHLRCRTCRATFPFSGLVGSPGLVSHDGVKCANQDCGASLTTLGVVAQVEAAVRQHLARYYSGWLVCDDPSCGARTRQMSVYGHRCLGPKGLATGCLGKMNWEFGEKDLWNQLLYLQSLFDVDRAGNKEVKVGGEGSTGEELEKVKVLAEVNRERFRTVKDTVEMWLKKNGRQWVQMDSLFGFALEMAV